VGIERINLSNGRAGIGVLRRTNDGESNHVTIHFRDQHVRAVRRLPSFRRGEVRQ